MQRIGAGPALSFSRENIGAFPDRAGAGMGSNDDVDRIDPRKWLSANHAAGDGRPPAVHDSVLF